MKTLDPQYSKLQTFETILLSSVDASCVVEWILSFEFLLINYMATYINQFPKVTGQYYDMRTKNTW